MPNLPMAILSSPWDSRPADERYQIIALCVRIHFCDNGVAAKIGDKWTVEVDGGLREASKFVALTVTRP